MASGLSAKHFHDEEAAYTYVEERLWPHGAVCPRCGGLDRIGKMGGKSTRIGTYKCYECRKPFTVKIGTIFEASHVRMNVWLQAMYLIAGSKKGISSNQLHRILGVTLKTAWFMSHRIREAMRDSNMEMFGGGGGEVQTDETYIGNKPEMRYMKKRRGAGHKMRVVSLLDKKTGRTRSIHTPTMEPGQIAQIVRDNVAKDSHLVTDEARAYRAVGREFLSHQSVTHAAGEYVSKTGVTTNHIEGFFSIFKRGMRGIYQHCSEKHLHRYLAEYDFRYSNRVAKGVSDIERADEMLMGVIGKRLTYQQSHRD